jgi:hypothetical protein
VFPVGPLFRPRCRRRPRGHDQDDEPRARRNAIRPRG